MESGCLSGTQSRDKNDIPVEATHCAEQLDKCTVPVALVTPLVKGGGTGRTEGKIRCLHIWNVTADSAASISHFTRQLAACMRRDDKILMDLTYRGAPLSSDLKVGDFPPAAQGLRFAALYKEANPLNFNYATLVEPERYRQFDDLFKADRQFDVFEVSVCLPTNKIVTLNCCRDQMTMSEFVVRLERATGISFDRQAGFSEWTLRYGENEIIPSAWKAEQGGQTIASYGIPRGSMLELFSEYSLGLRGGQHFRRPPFVCLPNTNSMEVCDSLLTTPSWRKVGQGINVEGFCRNSKCPAVGRMVIDQLGTISFSLTAGNASCPTCCSQIQPITCGFYDCKWGFDGVMEGRDGWEDVAQDWKVASGSAYHRFQECDNMVNWHFLLITAMPVTLLDLCNICFTAIDGDEWDRMGNCSHRFHEDCLATWEMARPEIGCPACLHSL